MFRKHMRFHLGSEGSREWYDELETQLELAGKIRIENYIQSQT
jgi:bacterioferritin (cytochrome b1)